MYFNDEAHNYHFTVTESMLFFAEYFEKEGDMTWIKPEFDEKVGRPSRSKRLARKNMRKWKNGVVPYEIAGGHYTGETSYINLEYKEYRTLLC